MDQLTNADSPELGNGLPVPGVRLTEIPDIPEGEPLCREWKAFRREVQRLVREGQAGEFAMFKGAELVGVWDTLTAAVVEGRRRFGREPFLVQEIQLFVRPWRRGHHRSCRA